MIEKIIFRILKNLKKRCNPNALMLVKGPKTLNSKLMNTFKLNSAGISQSLVNGSVNLFINNRSIQWNSGNESWEEVSNYNIPFSNHINSISNSFNAIYYYLVTFLAYIISPVICKLLNGKMGDKIFDDNPECEQVLDSIAIYSDYREPFLLPSKYVEDG